jgi:hypothetical protein
MSYDYLFYIALGIVVFISLAILITDKSKTKFRTVKWLKSKIFIGMVLMIMFIFITPANPMNDLWINKWFGNTNESPTLSNHLEYNGEREWTGLDGVLQLVDGQNYVSNHPATLVATVTGIVYSGEFSAMAERLFIQNKITLGDALYMSSMTQIEAFTAVGGKITMTTNQLRSKQIVTVRIGTINPDETGANPLRSQFMRMIVQGQNGDTHPGTVNLGTGIAYYWHSPDEDELTIDLQTQLHAAVGATDLDISDDANTIFDLEAVITFGDDECNFISYYDEVNNRWWNWYVLINITEVNAATVEAIVPSASGYSLDYTVTSTKLTAIIQLTSPKVFTDNTPPTTLGYNIDQRSVVIPGQESIHYVKFFVNLQACTPSGGGDNTNEYALTLSLGTLYNEGAALIANALPGDIDNNYNVAGAATEYMVA